MIQLQYKSLEVFVQNFLVNYGTQDDKKENTDLNNQAQFTNIMDHSLRIS